jgi:hypothetical protein
MTTPGLDRAVPNLPSRDFDTTEAFYGAFGFERVDELYDAIRRSGVPLASAGMPRLHPVRMQEWGLRAGYLVDSDGTQLALIEEPVGGRR